MQILDDENRRSCLGQGEGPGDQSLERHSTSRLRAGRELRIVLTQGESEKASKHGPGTRGVEPERAESLLEL